MITVSTAIHTAMVLATSAGGVILYIAAAACLYVLWAGSYMSDAVDQYAAYPPPVTESLTADCDCTEVCREVIDVRGTGPVSPGATRVRTADTERIMAVRIDESLSPGRYVVVLSPTADAIVYFTPGEIMYVDGRPVPVQIGPESEWYGVHGLTVVGKVR